MNNENTITIRFNQEYECVRRDEDGSYHLSFKDPVIAKDIWNDIREYTKDLLIFVHNPSLLTGVSLLFSRFFNRRRVDKLNKDIAIYKSPDILAGIIQKQQQQIRNLKRRSNQRAIQSRRARNPWWLPELFEELRKARAKFPGNALTLTAFSEEAGEVVKATLDRMQGKPVDVSAEIIQAMAMCVRLLEEGDRVHVLRPDPRGPKTLDEQVQRTHASVAPLEPARRPGPCLGCKNLDACKKGANRHCTDASGWPECRPVDLAIQSADDDLAPVEGPANPAGPKVICQRFIACPAKEGCDHLSCAQWGGNRVYCPPSMRRAYTQPAADDLPDIIYAEN